MKMNDVNLLHKNSLQKGDYFSASGVKADRSESRSDEREPQIKKGGAPWGTENGMPSLSGGNGPSSRKGGRPMRIPQISSLKSKPVLFKDTLASDLVSYAKYLSETTGTEYEISDVVAYVVQDEKKVAEIQPKETSVSRRVSLKLPAKSWSNLEATAERTGLRSDEVIAELASGLLRDKNFLGWKAKQPATQETESGVKPAALKKRGKVAEGNEAQL